MALPVGTRLDKYELLDVLGQGGGGISYRAVDRQLEREVVLKEHFPLGLCQRQPGAASVQTVDAVAYERSLQAFCREARILAGLSHAGIVPVHEIFSACGTAFMVMGYVEGVTFREWMQAQPTAARMEHVLRRLLDALAYIHGSGVVHRDIKPANILIQEGDSPVLIDFGAALLGAPTHTLTLVGTPAYAAPEQFDAAAIPGPQADIYALGRSLLQAAEDAALPLPAYLRRTAQLACLPQPAMRYASAAAWNHALVAARRRPWSLFGGAAAVLIAAAGAAWVCTAPIPQQPAVAEAPAPAKVEPPKYHALQLVHHNDAKQFYRYSEEVLPPREEALVQAVLQAQQEYDAQLPALEKQYEAERTAKNTLRTHKRQYARLFRLRKALNDKVALLIRDYVATNYPDGDPYAEWTELLIAHVQELGLGHLRPLVNHHLTHPCHLVVYDENGFLTTPPGRKLAGTEGAFVRAILAHQQDYHTALATAEQTAQAQGQPLPPEQRSALALQHQKELNLKVLAELDRYIEDNLDDEHPELDKNEPLRRTVANKNLPVEG